MSAPLVAALAIVASVLAIIAFGPKLVTAWRRRRSRRERAQLVDPGEEMRAERRAERLLRTSIGEENWEAYRALGFLFAFGAPERDGDPGYGYLIYPHRPIVSFDARSGELLSELCVTFRDRTDSERGERLPDADDVLAKWMALRGDERGLLARANVYPPGRQVDPEQARRDVVRLGEWTSWPSDGLPAAP